jgi:hypothetical protein
VSKSIYSGELKIAEVTSRLKNVDAFVSLVTSIGFGLESKVRNRHLSLTSGSLP